MQLWPVFVFSFREIFRAEDLDSAMNDVDNYLEVNQEVVNRYLEYRNSDNYKSSPAYRMQQILVEFQESSGF